MKKMTALLLIVSILSGCSIFRTHKLDVDQGNIVTPTDVNELHRGMSVSEVKDILGEPVLINVFGKNSLEYVYTYQKAYHKMNEQRIILIFQNGRLRQIEMT